MFLPYGHAVSGMADPRPTRFRTHLRNELEAANNYTPTG